MGRESEAQEPTFDFASLESVSSHEAAKMTSGRAGGQVDSAPCKIQRAASLAQPPEITSRWSTPKKKDVFEKQNSHSERIVSSVNGIHEVEFPRKAPTMSYSQKAFVKPVDIAPSAKITAPKCSSVLCARLGCCLY